MAQHTPLSSEFRNYPFLTGEEFAEVCHHLDRRYCQATLGPVRRQWKLRVCSALNTSFALGREYSTYIQIIRPLEGELDDGNLSKFLDNLSFDEPADSAETDVEADRDMVEAEEADEVGFSRSHNDGSLISLSHTSQGRTAKETERRHSRPCQIRDTSAPDVPGALSVVQLARSTGR